MCDHDMVYETAKAKQTTDLLSFLFRVFIGVGMFFAGCRLCLLALGLVGRLLGTDRLHSRAVGSGSGAVYAPIAQGLFRDLLNHT